MRISKRMVEMNMQSIMFQKMTAPLQNFYTGFGLVLHFIVLLGLTASIAKSETLFMPDATALNASYPYESQDMEAQEILADFSRLTGLPVEGAASGVVSVDNKGGTAADFLDSVAGQTRSVWWFDGLSIRIEERVNMRSAVISTRGLNMEMLTSALAFAGLQTDRFTTRISEDGNLLNVVGPDGYIIAVDSLLDQIISARKARRADLPVVYRGEWADENTTAAAQQSPGKQIVRAANDR